MPLPIGQIPQNRYRILSLLSQGDIGTVHLAEDTRLPLPELRRVGAHLPDIA